MHDGQSACSDDMPDTCRIDPDTESGTNPLATTPCTEVPPPLAQSQGGGVNETTALRLNSITLSEAAALQQAQPPKRRGIPPTLPPLRSASLTHFSAGTSMPSTYADGQSGSRSDLRARRANSSQKVPKESPRLSDTTQSRNHGAKSPDSAGAGAPPPVETKEKKKKGDTHPKEGGAVIRRKRDSNATDTLPQGGIPEPVDKVINLVHRQEHTQPISTLFHRRKPVVRHFSGGGKGKAGKDSKESLIEFSITFGETDERLGCTWRGEGKSHIIINSVVAGSLAERVGLQVGMKLYSIEGVCPTDKNDFESLMGKRGVAMEKLRDGGTIAIILYPPEEGDLDGDECDSEDSYDIEFSDDVFQEAFEAVWLPCIMSCLAHTAFIQIPVVMHSVGLLWTLLIFLATILVSMLSLESVTLLLSRQSLPETLQLGVYQVLARHVGTEFGGAAGVLYLAVVILLNGVHAQGLGEAVYFFWDVETLCGCSETLRPWVIRATGVAIQIFVTLGTYVFPLTFVSLFELVGVLLVLITYILMVVGLLKSGTEGAWKPENSPSVEIFKSNWITTFDPDLPNPDNANLTVIECLCRIFPSALSILIVLGRATDIEKPQEVLGRSTRRAMALCWVTLIILVFCVSFSLARDLQDEDLGVNGTLSHWLFFKNETTEEEIGLPDGPAYLYYYHLFVASTFEAAAAGQDVVAPEKWTYNDTGGYFHFIENPIVHERYRPRYDVIDSGFLLPQIAEGGFVFELFVVLALLIQCLQTIYIGPSVILAMRLDHRSFFSAKLTPDKSWVFYDGAGRGFCTLLCGITAGLSVFMGQYLYNLVTIVSLVCLGIINGTAASAVFMDSVRYEKDVAVSVSRWKISLAGFVMCGVVMFYISWYVALAASLLALFSAKYLEMQIDLTYWGEGVKGMQLQHALDKLISLENNKAWKDQIKVAHHGNRPASSWRPQIMILTKVDPSGAVTQPRLLSVADQLKATRGLVIIAAVVEGDPVDQSETLQRTTDYIKSRLAQLRIRGFVKSVAARTYLEGFTFMMQGLGLGELSPNTVVIHWPDDWRKDHIAAEFTSTLRIAHSLRKALLVLKGVKHFSCASDEEDEDFLRRRQAAQYIDLWWLMHEGGLELLLTNVLRQHIVWKDANVRIIILVPFGLSEEDRQVIVSDVEVHLHRLQIEGSLVILPVKEEWIREFTDPTTKQSKLERQHSGADPEEGEERGRLTAPQQGGPIGPMGSAAIATPPSAYPPSHLQELAASHAAVTADGPGGATRTLSRVSSSAGGFEGFPMVDLVGEPEAGDRFEDDTRSPAMYHSECLNGLIQQSSADSDLVLINLPDCTRFANSSEFMQCTEALLKNIKRSILFSGTEEQVMLRLW